MFIRIIHSHIRYLLCCILPNSKARGGRRGLDHMVAGLPMQSVPITTDVVSSNLDQGEVCNYYVIKFVSGL